LHKQANIGRDLQVPEKRGFKNRTLKSRIKKPRFLPGAGYVEKQDVVVVFAAKLVGQVHQAGRP
jgi:hypothetical protein